MSAPGSATRSKPRVSRSSGDDSHVLHPEQKDPNEPFMQINGPKPQPGPLSWRARTPLTIGNMTIGERGSAPIFYKVERPSDARRLTVGARPVRGGAVIAFEATLDR